MQEEWTPARQLLVASPQPLLSPGASSKEGTDLHPGSWGRAGAGLSGSRGASDFLSIISVLPAISAGELCHLPAVGNNRCKLITVGSPL